jgi:hypothetical protein
LLVSWCAGGRCVMAGSDEEYATTWDTPRDLAAFFAWKQVGLGFSNLASRLVEARRWVVHMVKLKTDGSMRWATPTPATLALSFSFYYALGILSSFSFLFGPINRILEGWNSSSFL